MGANNGTICTVRPGKTFTEGVASHIKVTDVLVFTAFLKEHTYGKVFHWPVSVNSHQPSELSVIKCSLTELILSPPK